jgi:transposase-like protein
MAHGINANQLHKWRRQFSGALNTVAVSTPTLIPITVARDEPIRSSGDNSPPGRIDIELSHARVTLTGRIDLDVLHTVLATLHPR